MDKKNEALVLRPVAVSYPPANHLRWMFVGDLHLNSATPVSRKDDYAEAMLDKVENLAKFANENEVDFVVLGGDVFHTKSQPDGFLVFVTLAFRKFKMPVYTIVGNHDILYTNVDSVRRTPLGVLLSSGVVKWMNSVSMTVNGKKVLIQGKDYQLRPTIPNTPEGYEKAFLVAHQFVPHGMQFGEGDESFNEDEYQRSSWDVIYLGHDHMTYPISMVSGKPTVRPGAISRGTKHIQNRMRDVMFVVTDVVADTSKTSGIRVDFYQEKLEVKSAQEIFSDVRIQREDVGKKMSEFVKALRDREISDNEEMDIVVKDLCGGDKDLYALVRGYLINYGLVSV